MVRGHRVVVAAAVFATVALAVLLFARAVRADTDAYADRSVLVAMDLVVGAAFLLVPLLGRGRPLTRCLMVGVGLTWLAGSSFVWARSSHQGVLLVALVSFASGRPRGIFKWVIVFASLAVVAEEVQQLGVAGLFVAVVVVALVSGDDVVAEAYPAIAGAAVAGAIYYSWWSVHRDGGPSSLLLYEFVLLGVAVAFPFAVRVDDRRRRKVADRILGHRTAGGLTGLQSVLRDTLGDRGLVLERWEESRAAFAPVAASRADGSRRQRHVLTVNDGELPLARVASSSPMLDEPATADAACSAVRLVARNEVLRDAETRRMVELRGARVRLLEAVDDERSRVAEQLRSQVLTPLTASAAALSGVAADPGAPEVGDFVSIAMAELAGSHHDVEQIVGGAPPVDLGNGRIVDAVRSLAGRGTLKASMTCTGDVAVDHASEAALYYSCSEALANAAKHAGTAVVDIRLERIGDRVVLSVRDRGCGGADRNGQGLQGIADRLDAVNGRLHVDSPVGVGTTVRAEVPAYSVRRQRGGTGGASTPGCAAAAS